MIVLALSLCLQRFTGSDVAAPLHDGGDLTIDEEKVCFERKLIVVGNSSSEVQFELHHSRMWLR